MQPSSPDPTVTRRTALTGSTLAITAGAVGLTARGPAHAVEDPVGGSETTAADTAALRATSDDVPAWADGTDLDRDHPWNRRAASARPLRDGDPADVGLDGERLAQIGGFLREGISFDPQRFSGASVLIASQGRIVHEVSEGWALRWADPETLLPEDEWVPAQDDTIYDLASISKIFTATAIMQLVEQGKLALDDTVAAHLPRFAVGGKGDVRIRHLLTHVSGLPAFINLWSEYDDVAARIDAVLTVEPDSEPGTAYVYSDLGLITLGLIVEELTGQGLDQYVRENITAPLGMDETMYNPPPELLPRIAATEYMEATGELVRGHVHDENAWSLGGVAGHAGVFSTARDLATFAQMFLAGGRCGQARILLPATVREMFTDRIAEVTGVGGARRGLGPELSAWFYHAGLTGPFSGGHTGFTGTSFVIDPLTDTVVIMLANSVHPTREWSSTSVTRRQVSTCVADALDLVPHDARGGWHAGQTDEAAATLATTVDLGAGPSSGADGPARLELALFVHLETGYDTLTVEASADGGSTWVPLPGTLHGEHPVEAPAGVLTGWGERASWDGDFPLQADGTPMTGEVALQCTLTTDVATRGLGTWLGRLAVVADGEALLDTDRPGDREQVVADGWVLDG